MRFGQLFCAGLLGLGMSSVAFAGLTIDNRTNQDSSAIINGGKCSNNYAGGVTKHNSVNTVSDFLIKLACWGSSDDCKADIYMTDDCSGDKIGTASLDTKKGIKSVNNLSKDYTITSALGSFSVTLEGGPTLASKK